MYFTQDDLRKIEAWLQTRAIKDTDFQRADPLTGKEDIPIIQDGKNKIVDFRTLLHTLSLMELPDFLNVTTFSKKGHLTLEEAINEIPVEQRKLGLAITFHSEKGNWVIYQFKGTSLNQWTSLTCWKSIIEEAIEEFSYLPDEEDITEEKRDNITVIKFNDKEYNPDNFSGKGRVILRKNLVDSGDCPEDEASAKNILTQSMITKENTIYIIQYDFDLDGTQITIPNGCTLWFQGGTINSGRVWLKNTKLEGVVSIDDFGTAEIAGHPIKGQVLGKYFNSGSARVFRLCYYDGTDWKIIEAL